MKLTLSKWAINKSIMTWEVSWSEKYGFAHYTKKLSGPSVPLPDTTDSGVTIGIGYDCGQMSATRIRMDWGSVLPKHMVDALCLCSGKKKKAAVAMLPSVKHVVVPIEAALQVFYNTTIYQFAKQTLGIYPSLDKLHPVEVSTFISLVYNRGSKTTDNPKDKLERRKEMRLLVKAIERDDDKEMGRLIREMCRLWPTIQGLKNRRIAEAELIEMADTPIAESDKLIIVV